jgi:hypothetical protein
MPCPQDSRRVRSKRRSSPLRECYPPSERRNQRQLCLRMPCGPAGVPEKGTGYGVGRPLASAEPTRHQPRTRLPQASIVIRTVRAASPGTLAVSAPGLQDEPHRHRSRAADRHRATIRSHPQFRRAMGPSPWATARTSQTTGHSHLACALIRMYPGSRGRRGTGSITNGAERR